MKPISGCHAVVTGASRGLGVSIAQALAEEGVNLTLAARSLPDLDAVRTDVAALGVDAAAIACDVASADDRAALITRAEAGLGPIDILVNNAGIIEVGAFDQMDPDVIERTLTVNLTAAVLLVRQVLPGMLARGRGHIVNVASAAGKSGMPYLVPYSTSKFGLVGFSQALRAELHDSPVGCSVICPGFVAGDGMYARLAERGITAPCAVGTTTPKKVAEAVVRAITGDRAESIVNGTPVRPLLMFQDAFPDLHAHALSVFGLTAMGKHAGERGDD